MPTGAAIAAFIRFYGTTEFDGGRISWPWYRFLERWRPGAEAIEKANMAEAVGAGAVGVVDGDAFKKAVNIIKDEVFKER